MNRRLTPLFAIALAAFVFAPVAAHAATEKAEPTVDALRAKINRTIHSGRSLKGFYEDLVSAYGGAADKPLLQIAQDRGNEDQTRWAALFGLARVAGKRSVGVIRKFMTDSSWMMRDAALKTAAAVDAKELLPQIEQRLKDDALIVRTTAVEAIGHLKSTKSAPKLVDALFDPINFHGGKALWIHEHILSVIRDMHYTPAAPRLVDLLTQAKSDGKLQASVIQTLQSLTGKNFGNKPLKDQIYFWRRNTMADEDI